MLKRKTTFVIGAGASCELGLPSGDQLKNDICEVLTTSPQHAYGVADQVLLGNLRRKYPQLDLGVERELEDIVAAASRIRRGLPLSQSIDNYLHTHQADELVKWVGMAAITRVILRAERRSHLFAAHKFLTKGGMLNKETSNLHNEDLYKTWYFALARLLFSQVPKEDPGSALRNVRFVIFNYDRCLEEFLWLALQAYFDLPREAAAEVLSEVELIHPYGSLGPLPWQRPIEEDCVSLGGSDDICCFTIGQRLKTFTESVNSQTGTRVADAIAESDLLLVLGFGYLAQNIELLVPQPLGLKGANSVIGTTFGIHPQGEKVVTRLLGRLATKHVEPTHLMIERGTCADLFRNFDLHLRF